MRSKLLMTIKHEAGWVKVWEGGMKCKVPYGTVEFAIEVKCPGGGAMGYASTRLEAFNRAFEQTKYYLGMD
jgi:hypothetical protein